MVDKVKAFLLRRQHAYRLVFNREDQAAKRVLQDLARFCRANESTFAADPRAHAVAEGRREVWLRIQRHAMLDPNEFLKANGLED